LTATISHEQLNPLNSIINLAEYVDDEIYEALDTGLMYEDSSNNDMIIINLKTLQESRRAISIIKSSSQLMQLMNKGMINKALLK